MSLLAKLETPEKKTLALIISTLMVRLYIAGFTGLGVGESYYWRGVERLDWSYYDQPPMFFWLSAISTKIFGMSNFGLRLPAVLLFAGSSWLLFLITRRLFNGQAAWYAVALLNISFVFTVPIASWFQPDAPLLFFWLFTTYLIINILFETPKNAFISWMYVGLALGCTALSKYHALFLMASTFLFVLSRSEQRKWLRHPGPYLAICIMLLMLMPVFYWNSQHEWISFQFQGSRAGGDGLNWARLGRSVIGQMTWIAPWIWFPILGQLFRSGRSDKPQFQFLFWCAVLPIGFFTTIALVSRIGFHFHWQAPGYLMLFPILGAWTAEQWEKSHLAIKRWFRFSAMFTGIFVIILLVHMTTGFWRVAGPKLVGEKFGTTTDPTIEGIDFWQIRDRFEKEGWIDDDQLFVASEKWWQTGKIDWPLRGEKDILIFHPDPRNHAFFFDPVPLLGKDAIYVRYHKDHGKPSGNLTPFFENVRPLAPIEISRNGKVDAVLEVFYCNSFQVPEEPQEHLPIYRRLLGRPPF